MVKVKSFILGLLVIFLLSACGETTSKVRKDEKIAKLRDYETEKTFMGPKRRIAVASFKNETRFGDRRLGNSVTRITSYNVCYTKLLRLKKVEEDKIIGSNGFAEDSDEGKFILNLTRGHTVDVVDFYGIGATRKSKQVNLVVSLEKWNEKKFYDRLGIEQESMNILGVDIPNRITSYNVCYTKLLRKIILSPFFRDISTSIFFTAP